jgi:hypothetical protein
LRRDRGRTLPMTTDEKIDHILTMILYLTSAIVDIRGMVLSSAIENKEELQANYNDSMNNIESLLKELRHFIPDKDA